jgi:ATP-dependent exoDNAse (exonuclease V) beta subunit
MTRARDALVIPWYPGGKGLSPVLLEHLADIAEIASDKADPRALWVSDDALDLDVQEAHPVRLPVADAFDTEPKGTPAAAELAAWGEALARFAPEHDRPPRLVAPSSLGHGGDRETSPGSAATSPSRARRPRAVLVSPDDREPESGRFGTELGSLVHYAMERVAFDGADTDDVVSAAARSAGASADMKEAALSMVRRALESSIVRRASASSKCHREVPFSLQRGDVNLAGTIDLLFVEDGGLVVVDYKTDREPPGGYAALVDRYREQALAYAVGAEQVTRLPLKEVVLLFLSGPEAAEKRVSLDDSAVSRARALDLALS